MEWSVNCIIIGYEFQPYTEKYLNRKIGADPFIRLNILCVSVSLVINIFEAI